MESVGTAVQPKQQNQPKVAESKPAFEYGPVGAARKATRFDPSKVIAEPNTKKIAQASSNPNYSGNSAAAGNGTQATSNRSAMQPQRTASRSNSLESRPLGPMSFGNNGSSASRVSPPTQSDFSAGGAMSPPVSKGFGSPAVTSQGGDSSFAPPAKSFSQPKPTGGFLKPQGSN